IGVDERGVSIACDDCAGGCRDRNVSTVALNLPDDSGAGSRHPAPDIARNADCDAAVARREQLFAVNSDTGTADVAADSRDGEVDVERSRLNAVAGEIGDVAGGNILRDGDFD